MIMIYYVTKLSAYMSISSNFYYFTKHCQIPNYLL